MQTNLYLCNFSMHTYEAASHCCKYRMHILGYDVSSMRFCCGFIFIIYKTQIDIFSELFTLSAASYFQHIIPLHIRGFLFSTHHTSSYLRLPIFNTSYLIISICENIIWCLAKAGYRLYEVRYPTRFKGATSSGRRVQITSTFLNILYQFEFYVININSQGSKSHI